MLRNGRTKEEHYMTTETPCCPCFTIYLVHDSRILLSPWFYISRAAPPISPSLSWLLTYMKDNAVPGSPPLTAHGSITDIAGGLSFDGATSYLDSNLPATDCIVNPDLCLDGFSFGGKLKFDQAAVTVNSPKFIMDTGASSNHRGISMYQQMTALHVTLVTSNNVYKVSPVYACDFAYKTRLTLPRTDAFREASRGLGRKISHISWDTPLSNLCQLQIITDDHHRFPPGCFTIFIFYLFIIFFSLTMSPFPILTSDRLMPRS